VRETHIEFRGEDTKKEISGDIHVEGGEYCKEGLKIM